MKFIQIRDYDLRNGKRPVRLNYCKVQYEDEYEFYVGDDDDTGDSIYEVHPAYDILSKDNSNTTLAIHTTEITGSIELVLDDNIQEVT